MVKGLRVSDGIGGLRLNLFFRKNLFVGPFSALLYSLWYELSAHIKRGGYVVLISFSQRGEYVDTFKHFPESHACPFRKVFFTL
jgi:hypothetical protein